MSVDVVACQRCGAPCRFTGDRNPAARVMRRAAVPEGLCASCAITHFLKTTEPLNELLEHDVTSLTNPAVQAQIAHVMAAGHADAEPVEIDWNHVITTWSLPFPKSGRKSR